MQCHLSEVFFCSLPGLCLLLPPFSVVAFSLVWSLETKSLAFHWAGGLALKAGREGPAGRLLSSSCPPSAGPSEVPEPCLPYFTWVWALWMVILVRFLKERRVEIKVHLFIPEGSQIPVLDFDFNHLVISFSRT